MKNSFTRILALALVLAMLVPALHKVATPIVALTVDGYIGNMDANLTKDLISPAPATLNMENNGGIRFATNINTAKYEDLKAFCKQRMIKEWTIGTLIAPLEYVREAGEFSREALAALPYETSYIDIQADPDAFYEKGENIALGYDKQFVGSMINIKLDNRTRDFASIGYIRLTLPAGAFFTVYSYDNEDMSMVEQYATNLADLASASLEKDCWSDEERAMIVDLATPAKVLSVNSETVKDIRTTRNQLFFTYTKGEQTFYNRITYDGANGWRLQTNTQSYNYFKDTGAAQALALYLSEGFHDVAIPITVTHGNGEVMIQARGTDAYVMFSYNNFSLDFYSSEEELLYNLSDMAVLSNGDIELRGKMNATDGVFGGGERFDSVNHRGKTLNLYTSDSYDTRGGIGTYVAIPLFSTSRGGGMFINRYEPMKVTFPQSGEAGDWSLTINTEILDCYFYATGTITDVLQAYVDMTGHATLPEEWAQGYLVCRFQPDFSTLDGETGTGDGTMWYYNIEDIPDYHKYEYLVNGKNKPLEIGDVLPHKKALTINGISYYHYIIETETEDFNYNGITGESYFLRVSSKGGPAGAGLSYIVDQLTEAGMTPTAVILEGVTWYNLAKNASQWGTLKKFVTRMNEKNIKVIVYTALGHLTGADMASNYKKDYMLSVDIFKYDDDDGIQEKITTTTGIPKSDKTDNPDTVSNGTQNYLDITNPQAVAWYLDTVWGELMELGVDGLKIDFSESLPNEGVYRNVKVGNTTYSQVYIKFNWYNPSMFDKNEPHHAYASYFVSLINKEMNERAAQREGDTGFIVMARGGGIGLQRNPFMLAGDQTRRFYNLGKQLTAVMSSGMSGMPFVTYDMAGYAYYATSYHYYGGQPQTVDEVNGNISLPDMQAAEQYESEIFIRALQFTVFGTTIKTHGDVRHVYQMTQEVQDLAALYKALQEELAPYLRELSQIACDTGMPIVRHLVLEYPDDANVFDINDQFMYGDALMVAPILTCNTKTENGKLLLDYASVATRNVYLPAGEWVDLNTGEVIHSEGMTITVDANLAQVPVYLNTASAAAEQMKAIFAGDTWQAILAYANQLNVTQ